MKTYILKERLPGKQFEIAEFTFNRLPAEEKMLYIENTDNFPDADEQAYLDMYNHSVIPISEEEHNLYQSEESKETKTNQNKKKHGKNSSDAQSTGS